MSNLQNDPETRRTLDDFQRLLRQKSKQERLALLQQARDEALADELEEAREASAREAAALREALSRDSPRELTLRAREQAKSAALLLILLFLVLWLFATAIGRPDIIRLPGAQPSAPVLQPKLGDAAGDFRVTSANPNDPANMPGIGSLDQPAPAISGVFSDYYNQNGGERIFGRPLSPEREINGRRYQWFERARLEEWPEYAGTRYGIQGGLLGREFTEGRDFPTQTFFVSQPDMRYFAETGHGVSGRFLQFWYDAGGLDILGYPISEQIQEVLPDKQLYTVQYFERGRIEYHPADAPPFDMQVGLLGRDLYLNDSTPNIVPPPQPTPVPLPAPVQ
jgi:hypothetical protein